MVYRDGFSACPACDGALATETVVGHRLDRCRGCAGAWIDGPTLACIFNDMVEGARPAFVDLAVPLEARACPACRRPMATVGLQGRRVDRCETHGVWLDDGELEDVLRSLAGL